MEHNTLTIEIGENKEEKIYFIIHLDRELFSPFFYDNENSLSSNNLISTEKNKNDLQVNNNNKDLPKEEEFNLLNYDKTKKIDGIIEEIQKIVRMRGYVSTSSVQFSLLLLNQNNTILELIDLKSPSGFIDKIGSSASYIQSLEQEVIQISESNNNKQTTSKKDINNKNNQVNTASSTMPIKGKSDDFDITTIFDHLNLKSFRGFNNSKSFEQNNRVVLFYNSSKIPVFIDPSYTAFLPQLPNFFFDVLYLHNKLTSQEDKEKCEKVFNSLNQMKSFNWYSFENSGNLKGFQYYCYLLMCSPSIRIKQNKISSHQNNVNTNLTLWIG